MVLSNYKNNTFFDIEEISTKELNELRARDIEEDFDFDELKKYFNQKKRKDIDLEFENTVLFIK